MSKFMLVPFVLLALATSVPADNLSPAFGSATQPPVQIPVDANTGLPLALNVTPAPFVASAQ